MLTRSERIRFLLEQYADVVAGVRERGEAWDALDKTVRKRANGL